MSNVVSLTSYRRKNRKSYLAKHGHKLNRWLERFVAQQISVDFRQLASDYQAGYYAKDDYAWDYVHFREILADALDQVFGADLYSELMRQPWFDGRVITKDEIVERCLSLYILSECQYALLSK